MDELLFAVSPFDDEVARRLKVPKREHLVGGSRTKLVRYIPLASDRAAEASVCLEVAQPEELGELDASPAWLIVGLHASSDQHDQLVELGLVDLSGHDGMILLPDGPAPTRPGG